MPTELAAASVAELRQGLIERRWSAVEVAESCIAAAERQHDLNLFITPTHDRARAGAAAADAALATGNAPPLCGIPFAIKDMFCTRDVRTTAGSRILENFVPPYESAVTGRLWSAGATLLGKSNLDEFAMGSSTLTSAFGPAVNPIRGPLGEALIPGGSSGGSAAAVAAGIVPAALGTDTGGSVRQPASMCGIVGIKPTYGRCSRWGIVGYASSFDQAGVLTRDVRGAAIVLDTISGLDPRDSTSFEKPHAPFEHAVGAPVAGMTVGIPREFRLPDMPGDVAACWDRAIVTLESAGVKVREISMPLMAKALPTYYVLVCAEASSNLSRYDGVRYGLRVEGENLNDMISRSRAAGFGDEVQRRVLSGTYILSAGQYDRFYGQAQKVRAMLQDEFVDATRQVDALLFPTSPIPAFPIESPVSPDPTTMYLIDVFTVVPNLLGAPAISVPFGKSAEGLPLGMQVVAPWFREDVMFRLGEQLYQERA